jgi:predicted alpha/beta-fold hydrolase
VDNGFNVVMYDQRSHGASDNALITFGKGEAKDLMACVNFLKTIDGINISKLGAVGFSLGSGGLIYCAASMPEPIFKAIVLEGAYAKSFDTGLFMLQSKFGKFLGYLIGIMFFTPGTKMMSFGKFKHSQPYKFVGLIKSIPIMILRGKNDYMVPKHSYELLISSINSTKEIWYTENGNHTDSIIAYPEEYKKRVIGFLNKYL